MTMARKASKAVVAPLGMPAGRRRGDVVVLLYHRVGHDAGEIELPPEMFEAHLEELTASERILTLDEALEGSRGGGVVVTFDDGYRDFADAVVPLLVKHRVPAHLYLATGGVDGGPAALSWSQLRDAADTGLVSVGSHTHSHADLSRASEAEVDDEMRRSRDLIEDRLGAPCRHFAYPWCVASPLAERAARRLFRSAALPAWKTNRAGRIDPYRLGRVPILRSDGRFFFRRKVRGQLDTEAWVYRMARRGPWGRV
jgi:peptidoglycan/xylan/chitin deacetylase (PgdA/CDA1 family)